MAQSKALLFAGGAVDPALDQLFSTALSTNPLKTKQPTGSRHRTIVSQPGEDDTSEADTEVNDDSGSEPEVDSDDEFSDEEGDPRESEKDDEDIDEPESKSKSGKANNTSDKKRKRGGDDELEDRYLSKLAKLAEADEKRAKRQRKDSERTLDGDDGASDEAPTSDVDVESDSEEGGEDEDAYEVPKHETQDASVKNGEVERANRTVFLGNVSTDAIKSKESMKKLKAHLISCFTDESTNKSQDKIESVRFRSVAFATTALPRKAAYAKKDLMDATTKSTNVYVVYATPTLAKTAVQKLNGTVVLDRHLRADSVAHPTPIDHRRCVFVGNLGFVDDESLMQDKGDDEDKKPKKKKQPGDVEEGLWRQFGKAGTVESVRVIRDKSTRVGKGFAYVQFTDQVAVEKALEFNEKKFPPMLPRVLRVTRAKKITKTNSYKEKNSRPSAKAAPNGKVYNPKASSETQTAKGRATKMFGRAGAAQLKKGGIRRPEDFVFEGHRAKDLEGKATLNLKQKKKAGKPQSRSSRRGAAFKAAGRKKQS